MPAASGQRGRLRDLYRSFMRQGILPTEVDKQDIDLLLWIALTGEKAAGPNLEAEGW